MKRRYHLLIIDPQNDFCDLPAPAQPALPVPGAHQDMLRLARLIGQGGAGLTDITVTLDSHHRYDVAHPTFWRSADGAAPVPFTQIAAADVRAGRFLPRDAAALPRVLSYLDTLEAAGRYQLMVWPVHCEIGSWGHNVHDAVRSAYNAWEEERHAVVAKVGKGSNPWTEHYSAVMAEVPDPTDPASQLNRELIASLSQADTIYITGEAGSHCVKATTEHIADHIDPRKLVLVTDCMSPVTGFEAQYLEFAQAMQRRGARLATSGEVLPEWLANAEH
ncbi:cysteine hydrolase [Pseudoduganella sp. OTU4001]|uniref:cysteine hydrolase n=1 Tax=Pseudoduganella sp. OTU4001 TaxID=3043854 RepID=UPI00313B12DA